jgi:hypothetical protein
MKKTIFTPQGDKEITLTQQQLEEYAADGDLEAKKEICKQELAAAAGDANKRLDAIEKFLGV